MNGLMIAGAVLGGVGILTLAILILRKIPQVRVIDPETAQHHRQRKLRDRLMEERFYRVLARYLGFIKKALLVPWHMVQVGFRRFAGRLISLERSYAKKRHEATGHVSAEELHAMLAEAQRLVREGQYDAAEERLVEIISASPKHAPAYELLGRVYLEKKQYEEAKETVSYLIKLQPKEAEGHFLLAQIHEARQDLYAAHKSYAAALERLPNSPKYLDAVIESALAVDQIDEAKKGLEKLKEVNPENKKIAAFEERLGESTKEEE